MVKKFKNYTFAKLIRDCIDATVLPYANQANGNYHTLQIQSILKQIFMFKEYEISFELIKMLLYGEKKYSYLTHFEMINYIVDHYIGQTGYTRWKLSHKINTIVLNRQLFQSLMSEVLSFIHNCKPQHYLDTINSLFDQIDEDVLTPLQYSQFVKEYIGSLSLLAEQIKNNISQKAISVISIQSSINLPQSIKSIKITSEDNQWLQQNNSYCQKLGRLIKNEIITKCERFDKKNSKTLQKTEVEQFLYYVLQLQLKSIDFIILTYFDFTLPIEFQQMAQIISQIHFRQIVPSLIKKQKLYTGEGTIWINLEYFNKKIQQNCFFFTQKPSEQLLKGVFNQIRKKSQNKDTDQITLEEFRDFILVYCCNGKLIFRHQPKKKTQQLATPPSIMEVENSHYEDDEDSRPQVKVKQEEQSQVKQHFLSTPQIKTKHVQISQKFEMCESIEAISQEVLAVSQKNNMPIIFQNDQRIYIKDIRERLRRKIQYFIKNSNNRFYLSELRDLFYHYKCLKNSQDTLMKLEIKLKKQQSLDISWILNYMLHWRGQQVLKQFSKLQIKGKSRLNKLQLAGLLFDAYGQLCELNKAYFQQFVEQICENEGMSYFKYLHFISQSLASK